MALIHCAECEAQVSDRAAACPRCGAPIARRGESAAVGTPLTTTQGTAKRFKAQMIVVALLFWTGMAWSMVVIMGETPGSKPEIGTQSMMVTGSVVWWLVLRFRIWWHHK